MLLNYDIHENLIDSRDTASSTSHRRSGSSGPKSAEKVFHIISDKIKIPEINEHVSRKRLTDLLEVFTQRFGAAFVNGRAGTGKTTLAFDFAQNFQKTTWYRISSTDTDWSIFSRYFLSSLYGICPKLKYSGFGDLINDSKTKKIQKFIEKVFLELEQYCADKSLLVVLDDLHNVYDADWFEGFFKEILAHDIANLSLLFLARTQPPFPIWRLRSKQQLGFLDEKLLLFTKSELKEIIKLKKVKIDSEDQIFEISFGRISKVLELADLNEAQSSQ